MAAKQPLAPTAAAILCLFACAIVVGAQNPEAVLSSDLQSVYVTSASAERVTYLPARFRVSAPDGSSSVACVKAGDGEVLLSASAVPDVDYRELELLLKRAQARVNRAVSVTRTSALQRRAWLLLESTGTRTPIDGVPTDPFEGISIWQQLPAAAAHGGVRLIVETSWQQQYAGPTVTVEVNWNRIEQSLHSRVGPLGHIDMHALRTLSAEATREGWIKIPPGVESANRRPDAAQLLLALIVKEFVRHDLPPPAPDLGDQGLRLRDDVRVEALSSRLTIANTLQIPRVFVITQEIPSCG